MLRSRKFRSTSACVWICIAVTVSGCGGGGVGAYNPPAVSPNEFPASYKTDLLRYLALNLKDPTEFLNASISEPTLRHVGAGNNTASDVRYVVCVRLAGQEKVAIYFGGRITQFIDAGREQCSAATYQPFPELASTKPPPT